MELKELAVQLHLEGTPAACPIVSSSASPSKAGTPETGRQNTRFVWRLNWSRRHISNCFCIFIPERSWTKGAGVGGAILLAKINWEPKEAYENCQGQVSTWLIISPFHAFGNLLILRVTNSWLLPGTATMLTSLLIVFPSQMPFVHCGAPLADFRMSKTSPRSVGSRSGGFFFNRKNL